VNAAADLVDTSTPVSIQPHADVDVRERIEGRDPIQEATALGPVDAAKDKVAGRYLTNDAGIDRWRSSQRGKICGNWAT
jgi:hypothetical protein